MPAGTNVQTAAEYACPTRRTVAGAEEASPRVGKSNHRVHEWLDLGFGRVVLYLNTTNQPVRIRFHAPSTVTEGLAVKAVIALDAEVAAQIPGNRAFKTVEAFAIAAAKIDPSVRVSSVNFEL